MKSVTETHQTSHMQKGVTDADNGIYNTLFNWLCSILLTEQSCSFGKVTELDEFVSTARHHEPNDPKHRPLAREGTREPYE